MEIILVSRNRGRTWRLQVDGQRFLFVLVAAASVVGLIGVCLAAGWILRPLHSGLPASVESQWTRQLEQQRTELASTRSKAENDADALARRIAELQAQVMRLDAAGSRMTQIAHIDPGEFNFGKAPPMGGPDLPASSQPAVMSDVIDSLDRMQRQLNDRERQMRVLEDLLLAGRLQIDVKPSGWPVADGYISSEFGIRTDPFTGLRSYHPGIDFAAPEGSRVLAVASGIVTEAGPHAGYGNLVEIDHGNGYVTRYGHNERISVHVGDHVFKGQGIAFIGSTGRSTGPHVHFEVVLNGDTVNPEKYIEAAR